MFFIVAKSAGPSTQKERHTHITSHHNKKISRLTLNKNIFISPEENIVILCTENEPTKDEIMAVTKNSDGKYELENLKIDNKEKEIGGQEGDEMDKKVSNEIDEMLDFLDVSTNDNKENERELENEKEKGTSMRKKAPWERRKAS